MAKRNYQYRFMGNDANIRAADWPTLVSGSAFAAIFNKGVEQIGIQALPGTKFKLDTSPDWIQIGSSGIFELDLTNRASMTSLCFEKSSIERIKNGVGVSLLIDLVYQGD